VERFSEAMPPPGIEFSVYGESKTAASMRKCIHKNLCSGKIFTKAEIFGGSSFVWLTCGRCGWGNTTCSAREFWEEVKQEEGRKK